MPVQRLLPGEGADSDDEFKSVPPSGDGVLSGADAYAGGNEAYRVDDKEEPVSAEYNTSAAAEQPASIGIDDIAVSMQLLCLVWTSCAVSWVLHVLYSIECAVASAAQGQTELDLARTGLIMEYLQAPVMLTPHRNSPAMKWETGLF
jgi:hypothetical protein